MSGATATNPLTAATIAANLRHLWLSGQVYELRVPIHRNRTVAGWFDDLDAFAAAAAAQSGHAPAVYRTLNSVDPRLHARAYNRLLDYVGSTTTDADVLRRTLLLLDFDPRRPSDISSTDVEHEAAIRRACEARDWLRQRGWPDPLLADSGNGAHLGHFIDIPNDDASRDLVQRCLLAIAARFGDAAIDVDTSVFNAARIVKVYGTAVCKGDDTPERPHRLSAVLEAPPARRIVPAELLLLLAGEASDQQHPASSRQQQPAMSLDDMRAMLHAIPAQGEYLDWVRVLMAIHDVYPGAEGVQLAEEWSPGRDKEIEQKFRSFKRAGRRTVGIGTLVHLAKEHGWVAPKARVLTHKKQAGSDLGASVNGRTSGPPTFTTSIDPATGELRRFALTDLGNSERLLERFGHRLRYCAAWNRWLVYDGIRWRMDEIGFALELSKQTARLIHTEAADITLNKAEAAALGHWAIRSESRDKITAMLYLAQSALPITPEELDTEPYLLNCPNGTVDLRRGALRPHAPADLITKLAGAPYDPHATAPVFSAFLETVMQGKQAIISFLQRAAGYSATADVGEECMLVLHGSGRNGKSKFLHALRTALGEYAMEAAPALLMDREHGEDHPTKLADLYRQRLVSTVETREGRRMDEELVKRLTGGEPVVARRMREDFWRFPPSHKLWMATNHRPTVTGTDDAIWSRIHLVPFAYQVPEKERDHALADKLTHEAAGILRWIVDGCLAWGRDGLQPPAEIRGATAGYRSEMDALRPYLEERCQQRADLSIAFAALWSDYEAWCVLAEEEPMSKTKLGRRLAEKGFTKTRAGGGAPLTWHGLALSPTPRGPKGDDSHEQSDTVDTVDTVFPDSNARGRKESCDTENPCQPCQTVSAGTLRADSAAVDSAPTARVHADGRVKVDGAEWSIGDWAYVLDGATRTRAYPQPFRITAFGKEPSGRVYACFGGDAPSWYVQDCERASEPDAVTPGATLASVAEMVPWGPAGEDWEPVPVESLPFAHHSPEMETRDELDGAVFARWVVAPVDARSVGDEEEDSAIAVEQET